MKGQKPKLIRLTTSSKTLSILLKGQLGFLNQHFELIGVANNDVFLLRVANDERIKTIGIKIKREINFLSDLKSLIALIKVFRKEKPDIIHANSPKVSLLSMLAGWLTGVPVRVYTVTGLRFETATGSFRAILIAMERLTCYFATKVIPEGEGVKKTLEKNKITRKELKVIGNGNINGVDLNYYSKNSQLDQASIDVSKQWNVPEDHFVFSYVGRLVKDKGIEELVWAFNKLWVLQKKVLLLMVGPLENEVDPLPYKTIELLKTHPGIRTVGRHDDIRPYLMLSNVFVLPSYREGFPNVVLQAGALGLPCIVSDINGCNEIIIHGENGLIVPPKNSTRLFEAMSLLLNNEDLRTKLSANARTMIASRYEQKAFWAELLKTYQEYLAEANLVNE